MAEDHPVVVVGGGISGIAAARRLVAAGHRVRVLDRGRRLGGRMAVRTEQLPSGPHPVDVGAPYFTVRLAGFRAVVDGWAARGLARPWTDTFTLAGPSGFTGSTSSPDRWSSPGGMRSLVEDLAAGLDVQLGVSVSSVRFGTGGVPEVDGVPADAVVLAMPDPQAARVLPPELAAGLGVAGSVSSPALTLWAAWPSPWWAPFDAAFVKDSPLNWVADDGRSRGDGAPVLVAHSTPEFAAGYLGDPDAATGPMLAALRGVLGAASMPSPERVRVHRWSLASPAQTHDAPFGLRQLVGVCGDGWGDKSRVEQAWSSGDALGAELATVLARRPA